MVRFYPCSLNEARKTAKKDIKWQRNTKSTHHFEKQTQIRPIHMLSLFLNTPHVAKFT